MERLRVARLLLAFSAYGHAQWFFGNLYEAVVTAVPDQSLEAPVQPKQSLFAPGSPVRYYIPITPLAFLATVLAIPVSWTMRPSYRTQVILAASFSALAEALTAYVVTRINLKLFFGEGVRDAAERVALMRRWRLLNAARLVCVGSTLAMVVSTLISLLPNAAHDA